MPRIEELLDKKSVHLAFRISLWTKGVFALTEVAGGIAAFFVTRQFLVEAASTITQGELAEDPRDLVANVLLHSAQHLSLGARYFTALYLLSHGVIKLWLLTGLLRERLRYYPTALVVFALFVFYQLYRFDATHSLWLLVITAVDALVIGLTWHEYRYLRHALSRPG